MNCSTYPSGDFSAHTLSMLKYFCICEHIILCATGISEINTLEFSRVLVSVYVFNYVDSIWFPIADLSNLYCDILGPLSFSVVGFDELFPEFLIIVFYKMLSIGYAGLHVPGRLDLVS